jgi:hypothetical protein
MIDVYTDVTTTFSSDCDRFDVAGAKDRVCHRMTGLVNGQPPTQFFRQRLDVTPERTFQIAPDNRPSCTSGSLARLSDQPLDIGATSASGKHCKGF